MSFKTNTPNLSSLSSCNNDVMSEKNKNLLDDKTIFESSVRLSINSNEILNTPKGKTSISVSKEVNSRASSYYEESESHIPISYFMSIWYKLINQDLKDEKLKAKEIIKQYTDNEITPSKYKIFLSAISLKWVLRCCWNPPSNDRSSMENNEKNYQLEEEKILILALSFSQYSDENPIHWEILSSVYKCCNLNEKHNNRKGVPRYGKHWEDIGFQSHDPPTDFRGCGIFGLCQILFLVSSGLSESIKEDIIKLSQDEIHNFPFAIVGLNFTKIIIDRLYRGKLKKLAEKEKTYISVVNGIYRGIWIMFYRIWKSRKCQINDFPNILNELKKIVKTRPKYLLNMAIL